MRKRRVGVTARSRLIVGNQATGTPQIVTEIAAPPVSRTPMCTVAAATTECGWKRGDTGVEDNRAETAPQNIAEHREQNGEWRGRRRAKARMRRCLILRQGDKPPETPGPLFLLLHPGEGRESVKGPQAAQHRRALDRFPPFPARSYDQKKGASGRRTYPPPVGRHPTLFKTCTNFSVDTDRPSHGSRDRKGASGCRPFSASC